jgi:2'-5' RNA ligase
MTSKRIFFALWPDDRQRDRLRDVINSVAKTVEGKMVDRRNWHITLAFIGDFPESQIATLQERAAQIEIEPFRLGFDRLDYWARPKVACLIAPTIPAELRTLVTALNELLLDFGVTTKDRTYRPHITVVQNARTFTTERLAQRAISEWSSMELVESVSGPGGITYSPLKP